MAGMTIRAGGGEVRTGSRRADEAPATARTVTDDDVGVEEADGDPGVEGGGAVTPVVDAAGGAARGVGGGDASPSVANTTAAEARPRVTHPAWGMTLACLGDRCLIRCGDHAVGCSTTDDR